jgi:transcriptional regulator with XRE-family HTH domain
MEKSDKLYQINPTKHNQDPRHARRNAISERLHEYRIENDLTLRQLTGLIPGISVATLFRAENGRRLNERTERKIQRFLEAARVS